MWGVVLVVTLLAGAGIGYGLLRDGTLQSRGRLRAWQDAAASCGLQVVVTEARFWDLRLEARVGPVEVRIETCEDRQDSTQIVIEAPGPPAFHLVKIRPESLFPGEREIEIGDKNFDSAFAVEGPMRLAFALFDAETRHQMLLVSGDDVRLEISGGALQVEVADTKVPSILPRLLKLRRRFDPAMDIPRRLAENARQDPEDRVRLQSLLLLARELPGEAMTLETLRAACSDPSLEIRLRAARELGPEGRDVLLEIAEIMVYDDASAEAVSILERALPFERVRLILKHALRLRRLQTARACLEALGRSGAAAAVDELAAVMEQENGELAAAAAQALGETGSPAAEPPLVLALQREPADLRVAAANALGRVGSVAAVLPLKEVSERALLNRDLRRATRQAIAEIQSRLPGAEAGQLSLAGDEAGQLSLAEAEAGQLSLADNSSGQLSLTPDEAEEG